MPKVYEVELHFFDGKTLKAVFYGESTDEALKMAFGGKLNCTHILAKLANSEDKIVYSVSALAFAKVTEWKELVRKHTT